MLYPCKLSYSECVNKLQNSLEMLQVLTASLLPSDKNVVRKDLWLMATFVSSSPNFKSDVGLNKLLLQNCSSKRLIWVVGPSI